MSIREDAKNWDRLRRHVVGLRSSRSVVAVLPEEGADVIGQAVEIGLALLLGKPLVVFVPEGVMEGVDLPAGLRRAADEVMEGDLASPAARVDLMRVLERLGVVGL